jgi:hypothetical protein
MAGRVAYYGGISGGNLVFDLDPARRNCYNGSGITCTDLTSRYNGTLTNGVAFSTDNNGIFTFDGTDDFINFGTNTPNLYPRTNSYTWCGWLKFPNNANFRQIWYGNASGGNLGFGILLRESGGSNKIQIEVRGNLGAGVRQQTSYPVSSYANQWKYWSITLDATTFVQTTYVNGTSLGAVTLLDWGSIVQQSGTNLLIGNHQTATWYYDGSIGAIQVYYRALSATEILQNYNALKNRYI